MDMLNPLQLAYCAFAVILAFMVRGVAGFGGGAVGVPLLALVLPLQVVVPAVAVLNILSSIQHGLRDWRIIEWRVIFLLAPFTLVGIGAGLYILTQVDSKLLSRALGVLIVFYAIYSIFTMRRASAIPKRWLSCFGAVVSVTAGFVGALFGGAAGPLYVIYLNALKLERDCFRVTITTIMLFQGLTRIGGYAGLGLFNSATLSVLAAALPMMLVGSYFGVRLIRRFDQTKFNRALSCVLLVSGLALLIK